MPTSTPNFDFQLPLVRNPLDADRWGDLLNDNWEALDSLLQTIQDSISPTGTVTAFAGDTAPEGFLLCYGQAVDRTEFSDLFAAIGTTYGEGNGSTTFNVPDLRGRAVAGKDDMGGVSADRLTGLAGGVDGDVLGAEGGEEAHVLTEAELAAHTHTVTTNAGASFTEAQISGNGGGGTGSTPPSTDEAGGDEAHNNVQPTLILNYIIST